MPYTPAFLTRLGLDTTADERAIRRAYARLLKQIDQETEPARFQSLREDYEQAIAWLSWRATDDEEDDEADAGSGREAADSARQAPAPASDVVLQSPLPPRVDPDALADDVFEHFLSTLPRLHGAAMADAGDMSHDHMLADELRRCLDDERLLNIAASTAFEARIVCLLAGPRQANHETLFDAAVEVFGWMSDPRRLEKFHHAGAIVNRAIDERNMFNAQETSERTAQQQALHALRLPALPATGTLRVLMPHVDTMMARFPVLMNMRVDHGDVDRWRARWTGADGYVPPLAERARTYLKKCMQGQLPAFLVFAIVLAIAVAYWSTPPAIMPVHRVPPPGIEGVTVVAVPLRPLSEPDEASRRIRRHWPTALAWLAPVRPQKVLLTPPRLDAIASRFDYKVDKETRTGLRALELDVYLFEEGDVKLLKVARSSGDQRFDEAVKKAFRDAGPYPRWSAREFKLVYWATVTHRHLPGSWAPAPVR